MKENTEGNKKQLLEIQATDLLLRFTTNESKITVLAYLISQVKAILYANNKRVEQTNKEQAQSHVKAIHYIRLAGIFKSSFHTCPPLSFPGKVPTLAHLVSRIHFLTPNSFLILQYNVLLSNNLVCLSQP